MKAPKYAFRVATFAVVVLVVAGLITTLLQEARAIHIDFVSPDSTITGGTTEFTVDAFVPPDQRIPIEDVEVIIEKQASDQSGTDLAGKARAAVSARVRCAMGTVTDYNCPDNSSLRVMDGASGIVTKIRFIGAFLDDASSESKRIGDTGYGYFNEGLLRGSRTGYGYDTVSFQASGGFGGYGYGYQTNDVTLLTDVVGFGYGYDGSGDLVLRFKIDVNTANLGNGVRYITLQLITGSSVLGDFSSAFHAFNVNIGSGGGGGGGSGEGTGSGQTQTINASPTTVPAGATSAYTATIATASVGNTVVINTGDTHFPKITLHVGTALSSVTVTIVKWPATATAAQLGVTDLPMGLSTAYFLSLTLSSAGTGHTVDFQLSIPESLVTDAAKAALIKFVTSWQPQAKVSFTLSGGFYTATVSGIACCSVFAVAVDTTAPTVDLALPTTTVTSSTKVTATAADNLQVSQVKFYVNDVEKGVDTTAPYEFTLVPSDLGSGTFTVKAIATDFVGNTGEDSGPVQVQSDVTPTTGPTDTEEGAKKGLSTGLIVAIVIIVIALIIGAFVLAGKKPPAKK